MADGRGWEVVSGREGDEGEVSLTVLEYKVG